MPPFNPQPLAVLPYQHQYPPGYAGYGGYGSQSILRSFKRQFGPGFRRGQQYKLIEKGARRRRGIITSDIAVRHPIAQAKIDEAFATRGMAGGTLHAREKRLAKHRMVDIPTAQMYAQRKGIREATKKQRIWDYLI